MAILYGAGSQRVIQVASSFRQQRARQANEKLGTSHLKFHPLMSRSDILSDTALGSFEVLIESQKVPCLANPALELRKKIYEPLVTGEDHGVEGNLHSDFIALHFNKRFPVVVGNALDIIRDAAPWLHTLFNNLIVELVPVRPFDPENAPFSGGYTSASLQGVLFLNIDLFDFPLIDTSIAIGHELGHSVLDTLMNGGLPFTITDIDAPIISGVRKVERPAILALHASMALGYMLVIERGLLEIDVWNMQQKIYLQKKIIEDRKSLEESLGEFNKLNATKLGKLILKDLDELLALHKN